MSALTPEQFHAKMLELKQLYGGDPEAVHARMDDLMCSVLMDLGYGNGVTVFNDTEMWYA